MDVKNTKTIWLVCINAQTPDFDSHLRHQKFAKYLSNRGYNVYIIIGSYFHYLQKNMMNNSKKFEIQTYGNINYVLIKMPSYKSLLKRVYSTIYFSLNLLINSNRIAPRPDVFVHNMRVPFDSLVYFVSKKLKSKYIAEVWDLWPESFVAFKIMNKNNPFLRFFYLIEKKLYEKAKCVIFTMEGAKQYIIDKRWDLSNGGKINLSKIYYVNNGVDLDEFNINKKEYKLENQYFQDKKLFKIVYLGSIRHVNNVKLIIDVMKNLIRYNDIVLLIYGNGDQRIYLEKYCMDNNITNVKFMDNWLEIKYVPYIVSSADLNILNYAYNDIERYGGSQGKLFQYLAAGKPIVSNIDIAYSPIKKYHTGISENLKDSLEYTKAILEIYNMFKDDKKSYLQYCNNSLQAANEYDYQRLASKFENIINNI